jgi:uncharacterized protein
MLWIIIGSAAFSASFLTFFSGFGLGTLLMPVMAVFLPVPVAIAITALVHWLTKIAKAVLLWRHIDRHVLLHFGLPALICAIPGALLLDQLSRMDALGTYTLGGREFVLHPVKLAAGILLLFFATAEWLPFLQRSAFLRIGLAGGGALSGFFGGLTGHQGAFRSAFLLQQNISGPAFIATHAAIAVMVDTARLVIYGLTFDVNNLGEQATLMAFTTLCAFLGVSLGARWLHRTTIRQIQLCVSALMYALGVLLCAGMI